MIRINLLPVRAARKKESLRFQLTIAGLATFFVVALVGVFFFKLNAEVSFLKEKISITEKDLAEVKKTIGELDKIKDQKKLVEEKLSIVRKLDKERRGPLILFKRIEDAMPEKAWLTSLTDTGVMITLNGRAINKQVVSQFMRGLERHEELGTVELKQTQKVTEAGRSVDSFTITLEKKR